MMDWSTMKDNGLALCLFHQGCIDFSSQLKARCTNNQAKYETLLFVLELLNYMGVTLAKVFGDS